MQQNDSPRLIRDYRSLAREYYSGRTFVAFDTETTGLKSNTDYIMEIGAVKFNCEGLQGDVFDFLCKPPVELTPFLTDFTHITNEMLSDKNPIKDILPLFLQYIGDDKTILIAHNAPFDVKFTNNELMRNGMSTLNNLVIDTLPLARWAYPQFAQEQTKGQYTLQSLASRFKINVEAAHRAYDDAKVCMELFKQILKDTDDRQKDYSKFLNKKNSPDAGNLQLELF